MAIVPSISRLMEDARWGNLCDLASDELLSSDLTTKVKTGTWAGWFKLIFFGGYYKESDTIKAALTFIAKNMVHINAHKEGLTLPQIKAIEKMNDRLQTFVYHCMPYDYGVMPDPAYNGLVLQLEIQKRELENIVKEKKTRETPPKAPNPSEVIIPDDRSVASSEPVDASTVVSATRSVATVASDPLTVRSGSSVIGVPTTNTRLVDPKSHAAQIRYNTKSEPARAVEPKIVLRTTAKPAAGLVEPILTEEIKRISKEIARLDSQLEVVAAEIPAINAEKRRLTNEMSSLMARIEKGEIKDPNPDIVSITNQILAQDKKLAKCDNELDMIREQKPRLLEKRKQEKIQNMKDILNSLTSHIYEAVVDEVRSIYPADRFTDVEDIARRMTSFELGKIVNHKIIEEVRLVAHEETIEAAFVQVCITKLKKSMTKDEFDGLTEDQISDAVRRFKADIETGRVLLNQERLEIICNKPMIIVQMCLTQIIEISSRLGETTSSYVRRNLPTDLADIFGVSEKEGRNIYLNLYRVNNVAIGSHWDPTAKAEINSRYFSRKTLKISPTHAARMQDYTQWLGKIIT